jgi:hypothetical protein
MPRRPVPHPFCRTPAAGERVGTRGDEASRCTHSGLGRRFASRMLLPCLGDSRGGLMRRTPNDGARASHRWGAWLPKHGNLISQVWESHLPSMGASSPKHGSLISQAREPHLPSTGASSPKHGSLISYAWEPRRPSMGARPPCMGSLATHGPGPLLPCGRAARLVDGSPVPRARKPMTHARGAAPPGGAPTLPPHCSSAKGVSAPGVAFGTA